MRQRHRLEKKDAMNGIRYVIDDKGRKVAVVGRSMMESTEIAQDLGYLKQILREFNP